MAALILPRRLNAQPQQAPLLAPQRRAWEWVFSGPTGARNLGRGGQGGAFSGTAGGRSYGAQGVAYLVGQGANAANGLQFTAPSSAPVNHCGVIVFARDTAGIHQGLFDSNASSGGGGFYVKINAGTGIGFMEVDSRAVSLTLASLNVAPVGINVVAWSHNATTLTIALNGIVASVADATAYAWGGPSFGSPNSGENVTHRQFLSCVSTTQTLTPNELASITLNPWQIFTPPPRRLWAAGSAGGVSASSANTDGADVLVANAAPIISGSSATTDGTDTLAASVAPVVSASSANTDAADLLAASAAPVVGISSATNDGADTLAASAAPLVSASSAKTDGADVLASSLSVIVAASGATTDGADVLASSVAPVVSAISSTIEGVDVLAANAAPIVAASGATTDGADVLAANVAPVASNVSASSATTDGADVVAAAVSQIIAASSATIDGADALSAAVSIVVAASSVTTDGADALASNVAPLVGASSATTDGADMLAASVAPVASAVSASSAIVEGADVLAATAGPLVAVGGGYDDGKPKKKRYTVRVANQLLSFDKESDAANALILAQADDEPVTKKQRKAIAKSAVKIDLPAVKQYAESAGAGKEYAESLAGRQYERLIAMFEDIRDEEDVEFLMMHA